MNVFGRGSAPAAGLMLVAGALGAATITSGPDGAQAAAIAGTVPATSSVAEAPTAGYELAWADEFNGTAVDTSQWDYRTDTKALSMQRPENVTVGNGLMTVHLCPKDHFGADCAQQEAGTQLDDLYTGGGLITKHKLRYGYYETRAKTFGGDGWHSAFWAAEGGGGTDPKTEIDGFEVDGHAPNMIRHNVIAWRHGGVISEGFYDVGFDTSAAFHTYGFEWLENSVKFYVDGTLAWSTQYPPDTYTHNFLKAWLTAIAILPSGADSVDDDALPGKVQFDYFRYYERDAYADNDAPSGYTEIGTGWGTSGLAPFAGLTARFSCDSGAAGRWTFTPPADGTYQGYFFRVGGDGGQVDAPVTVWDGSTALSRTQVDLTVSGSAWVPLGSHNLDAGSTYIVRIDKDGPGCIRADTVKFVRS